MSTSEAVAREAAWLNTVDDGLPNLPASGGGPWKVVQAYWPGPHLQENVTGIYVQRARLIDSRFGGQRLMPRYQFTLKLWWPYVGIAPPAPENTAQALDDATDLLVQRIRGPVGDKSHGGRFLSVGETQASPPEYGFEDPESTIPASRTLRATVSYMVDDFDLDG